MKKKVLVIGGGLAGLSASLNLLEAGFAVDLVESRKIWGGKVSAWKDKDQDWIESGLHVFFGSYLEIFKLMKKVNIYQNIDWQTPSIKYKTPEQEDFYIKSNEFLPCPLNLLPNLVFSNRFNFFDLLKYCRAIIPVLKKDQVYIDNQDQKSFLEWVDQFQVSQDMINKMFLPMTLSLKFLPVEKISAQVVLNVFKLFITNPKGFKIGFLNGSPEEKLTKPIVNYLEKQGAFRSFLGTKIKELKLSSERLELLSVLSEKEEFKADYYLFCLPAHKFQKLLSPYFEKIKFFENLKYFNGVPVANAQFWLDQQIVKEKNLHFGTGGTTPVFADMNLACQGYKTIDNSSLIETVIAPLDSKKLALSNQELLDLAWQEIKTYFPKTSAQAKLKKASLVKIPHSVYAPIPKIEKYRPKQAQSPCKNLFIATGFLKQNLLGSKNNFFDSMEGAVTTGKLAAEELIEVTKIAKTAEQVQ